MVWIEMDFVGQQHSHIVDLAVRNRLSLSAGSDKSDDAACLQHSDAGFG